MKKSSAAILFSALRVNGCPMGKDEHSGKITFALKYTSPLFKL